MSTIKSTKKTLIKYITHLYMFENGAGSDYFGAGFDTESNKCPSRINTRSIISNMKVFVPSKKACTNNNNTNNKNCY